MNVAKATLLLLTLSLLAKQSTALLHPNLRGFSLEVKKFEKPGYLLELENEEEKTRQRSLGQSPTTINLLDTVAAPDFEYTETFGRAIALSADGSCLAIGQPGARPRYGKVHVYKRQHGSPWQRTAVVSKGFANHADMFASTIGVSADCTRIVVGDPCPYHGYSGYKRVVVYDVDEDGEWNVTATLQSGTPLANGGQLDLNAQFCFGFGREVLVSQDGGRIFVQAPAVNGGIFDVDWEGIVTPVGNETASALSADGNRIASTIVDDRGNNEYSVSVRVSDYDAVADDWISHGNDVFIGMANSPYITQQLKMNGPGNRLFLKVSLAPEEWELFVIDDTGSGFDVLQPLGQVAQQAGLEVSTTLFGTDYSGKLLLIGSFLLQEEEGQWTARPIPGLDGPVDLGALSFDGSIIAVRSSDPNLQQYVVSMFEISNGTDPVPEPTAPPTFEPTPNQQGVLVKPTGKIKGLFWPVAAGRGSDPFPSNYALSTNGKCIIAAYPYLYEDEYMYLHEGALVVYESTSTSEWLPTFEFRGDNPTGVGHKLAISADCSRIAFSTAAYGDLSVQVYDRSPNNTWWEKTIELKRGTTLASGGEIGYGSLASLAMTEDGAIIILPLNIGRDDIIGKIHVLNVTNDGRVNNVGKVITLHGPIGAEFPGHFGEGGLSVSVSGSGERFVIETRIREEQSDAYYDPLFLHYITFDYDHVSEDWSQYDDFVIPREVFGDGQELSIAISRTGDRFAVSTEGSEDEKPTVLVLDDSENGFVVTSNLWKDASQARVNMTEVHNSTWDRRFTMNGSGDVIAVLSPGTETYMIDNTLQSRGEVFLFRQNRVEGTWDLAAEILPPGGFIFPGCCDRNVISISRDASVLAVKITDRDEYDRNSAIALYEISYQDGIEPTIEPTAKPTPQPTPEPTPEETTMKPTPCGPTRQKVCIDFSSTDERDLAHGDYVEHDWFGTYGMNLAVSSFNGGYLAQGPRIFDTARLDTRDPDLGSPNEQCTPAGPGVGLGGVPGAPGENCVAQGNVLIIQQDNGPNDTEPDDNAYGGTIEFMFDSEGRKVLSIGMLDVDSYASLKIRKNDGSHNEIEVEGLGDNAFQEESIGEEHVSSLEFSIPESGAVSYLCFCDDPSLERIAVELIPAELAIPAPGQEVTFLVKVKHHAGDSNVTITTILETSVGDLNGKGTCSTPQTIAPDGEYSCTFPSSVAGLSGTTVTKIIAATGINNEGIPLLDTASAVVSLIGAAPEPQETCIRFDETPDGTKLIHGDWIKDQWFDMYGMMIIAASTDGGYTPDGKARIFDTTLYNSQDVDLGSPNQDCVSGGPGIGHGGIPGAPGENCESQGNVVIIQEHPETNEDFETLEPDDNAYGGSLTFTFDQPLAKLTRVGLMDIEVEEDAFYKVARSFGAPVEKKIAGLGDNSIQEETIDVDDVTSLELTVSNSIGVRYICFQQIDSTSTEQPTLEPTAPSPSCEPTTGPCVSTFADLQDLASRAIPHDVIALCGGEILTESAVVLGQSNLKLCCSGVQDCILKSSGNDRNLLVTGMDFTVQGITFLDGVSDGPGGNVKIDAGGDHVVRECEFVGGEAYNGGGNLFVQNAESVSVSKTSFLDGKVFGGGSGMAAQDTVSMSIEESLFKGNRGTCCGAVTSNLYSNDVEHYYVSMNKTTFIDNTAGAYFVTKSTMMPLTMLFVDSRFESNVGGEAGVAQLNYFEDLENLDLTMYGNSGFGNVAMYSNCTGFLFRGLGDSLCIGVSEDYP